MSEPSLAQLIWEYLKATVSYWWLIVPGVLMPLPDLWKYLHPQRRELSIPKWLRWTLPLLCLSLAQFLAYRNASINRKLSKRKSSWVSETTRSIPNSNKKNKKAQTPDRSESLQTL